MVEIGDTVIWVDEDLVRHNAKVTKVKLDNQLNLEYLDVEPKVIVTSGAHRSVQHPAYGCYWMKEEE